jgi:antitoxin component of MazEF toxin-antitoxin module
MTVMVKKLGGRVAVVIPKAMANEMELFEGTALNVPASRGAIVMRNSTRRPRRSLKQIVAQIKPASYRRRANSDARIVGKEIW